VLGVGAGIDIYRVFTVHRTTRHFRTLECSIGKRRFARQVNDCVRSAPARRHAGVDGTIETILKNSKGRPIIQHDLRDFAALPRFPGYLN
jgi:hypothetical protein